MVMYRSCYDASSTEEDLDRPLVVAGLFSTVDRWARFEREWAEVLARPEFNVEYLHMKEFTTFKGPFKHSWQGDEPKRNAFLAELVNVAERGIRGGYIVRLDPRDFHIVNERYRLGREWWPSPYPLVALKCVRLVEEWVRTNDPMSPVRHVIEKGDIGQSAVHWVSEMMPEARIAIERAQDPITKEYFIPFQVANLVSYEMRRLTEHLNKRSEHDFRPAAKAILRQIPLERREVNQESLFAECRDNPDLYPRRVRSSASSSPEAPTSERE